MAFSSGAATLSAIVCASAPDYVARTTICGGVSCGYSSTAEVIAEITPAITMIIETTLAKTGLSIKNLENIIFDLPFVLVAFEPAF